MKEKVIRYCIYGQDGYLVRMTCRDSDGMRRFVEQLRRSDKWGGTGESFWRMRHRWVVNWWRRKTWR